MVRVHKRMKKDESVECVQIDHYDEKEKKKERQAYNEGAKRGGS